MGRGGTVTWPMNNRKSIGNHRRRRTTLVVNTRIQVTVVWCPSPLGVGGTVIWCPPPPPTPQAQTPRPVAEELPGVMPPGRPWKKQGPHQQRHGPYTQIQPAPKKVKPEQERQRFKVQALSQLDAIAEDGLRAVNAELTV